MLKDKRGFSLLELLGSLVVLTIILLIVAPAIQNYLKESKEKLYDIQIDNIALALKSWASDNQNALPENDGDSITLTLLQLKQAELIEKDLINPLTQEYFPDDMTLVITKNKNNYKYKVNKDSGTVSVFNQIAADAPAIFLIGDALEYVELNGTYYEQGAIASTYNGTPIKNYTIEVTGDDTSVQTDKISNYIINYKATDPNSGLTSTVNRTVIVRDTTPPILVVPANITIEKTVTTFDLMEGVSATDNSKENVTIEAKHNLTLGVPGNYTITYTAKDIYGNKTSTDRIIRVNK